MLMNANQLFAIERKYQQSPDGAENFEEFLARASEPMNGGVIALRWCGMWLGIEEDGYTHS
jgi:hypothetical protein